MARYIPKSKVSILQTAQNEFVIASTLRSYNGSYMELSDGTFFAGNNPQKPGEKLLKRKPVGSSFGKSNNNSTYRKINRSIYNELSKKTPIPISKPQPTNKDYERGYFTRYFCKRVNDKYNYFEINKKTYDSLNSKTDNYDYNLYIIGEIKWILLETPKNPVIEINDINVKLLLNIYPFLNVFFNILNEYEPLHTRNFIEKLSIKEGTKIIPYEGYFHQHPEKGFMEGPFHSTKPHKKLFTNTQLDKDKQNTITQLQTQNDAVMGTDKFGSQVSVIQPGKSSPTPSAPSVPSSGGGGGY